MSKRREKPKRRAWQPMTKGVLHPMMRQAMEAAGEDTSRTEAWGNDLYQAVVRYLPTTDVDTGEPKSDMIYISLKRHDRHVIRDWRHLQQIKNEIAGPEREACEIFPAESRLVDTSNEYHLWVMPEGEHFPFGYTQREVAQPEEIRAFNAQEQGKGRHGKARQRPWQPGLTTGVDS